MTDAGTDLPFPDDTDLAIVSHNGRATLPRVFERLAAAGAPLDRAVLYDIGSTDGTAEWIAREWPVVRVHRLEGNVGPNPARNLALQHATRPLLLLLDADAYVHADTARRLHDALDRSARVGMVAPVVVQTLHPDRVQYASVDLHFICEAVNRWLDRPVRERGTASVDIGTAPGVALLIDVTIARDIGLFDERYFMGKDDGDFCYRLRMAGYRLVENGQAIVEHEHRARSTWMFRYQIRNRWYFMLKNYGGRTLVVLAPLLLVHELVQFGMLAAKGHLRPWIQAVRDLLTWLPSIPAERARVQRTRVRRDRDLLVSEPLLVRDDLVGGSVGRLLKRAYDGWLHLYWQLARHLVS